MLALEVLRIDNNLYTQIGIILLIALSAKNAILIVDVARDYRLNENKSIAEAALDAARARFRPILMTSFAFILGVVPLILSSGAGAEMRRTLGTAVFSGMLGVTLFGIFLTPVFFSVIQWAGERWAQAMADPEVNGAPRKESHPEGS